MLLLFSLACTSDPNGSAMNSLDEYLDSYLNGSSDPGTAVMLIGHWGSGKTHYIQSYFRRRAELSEISIKTSGSADRKWWHRPFRKKVVNQGLARTSQIQHLYASFFGADSAEAISDQFLSQLYPVVNSTLGKVLGAAAIRISNITVQAATAGMISDAARDDDARAITSWLSNPKGRVLVFDDLERAGMPIEMCLSIINSYVERDGLKVIVLANDAEIALDSAYGRWKEKVIGKTVRVVSDSGAVLDSLIAELDDGPVKRVMRDERAALLAVIEASTLINYRSVRSLVFDAQRLLNILDRRLYESHDGVLELLKFSIALGGELRAGRLDPADVEVVQKCFAIRVKDKSKRTDRDTYILDLSERFASVLALESVVPASELVAFWLVGSLDVEAANAAVLKNPLVVGVHAQPAWQRLWELRRLSISRYEDARADLLASIEQRQLYTQGEILHVAGIALTLEDYGVGLFPQFKEVHIWVQEYASDPIVFNRLERSLGWFEGVESYAGLGFHKREDSRFVRASDVLELLVEKAEQKRLLEDLPELLLQIRDGDYSNVYSFGTRGSLDGEPWLHLVNSGDMADLLLRDGVMKSPLLQLFIRRYTEDLSAKYRVEWRFLRALQGSIRQRISGLPEPFRTIATESLNDASLSIREALVQVIAFARRRNNQLRRRKRRSSGDG